MAEIEFRTLSRNCLKQRLPDETALFQEIHALEDPEQSSTRITSRFSIQDARTKLHRLYPINS